jgi:hypothetical protein
MKTKNLNAFTSQRLHTLSRLADYRGGCSQMTPPDMGPVARGVHFEMTFKS